MIKIRFYTYEILSLSFGLALLAFFGTLSFFPIEMMLLGEGLTWYWVFIFLAIGIIISYFLLSFFKKSYSLIIIRFFDILATILVVIITVVFLAFTSDLLEPWLIQGAWFLRYNGLIMGLFMSCIIVKTVASLSFLISKFNDPKEVSDMKERSLEFLTLLIIVSSFSFYIIEFLIYRYLSFLNVLLSIFFIQLGLLTVSIILISHSKYKDHANLSISETYHGEGMKLRYQKSKLCLKLNMKLVNAGTCPKDFWRLFTSLILIAILVFIMVIVYVMDIFIHTSIPRELDVPVIQILSYILLICLLLILTFRAFNGRITRKMGNYYENKKYSQLKISFLSILEGQKALGLFLVISQIIYFFEFPIYYPVVVSFYLIFGIIGATFYMILGKTEKIKKIMYIIAIFILIINFLLTYIDGVSNAQNVGMDPSFDEYFPFIYLHSWLNFILVGVPIGIILSDFLLKFAFKHTDGGDSINRALFIAFSCFVFALLTFPGNFFLNTPGGDPNLLGESTLTFFLFCLVLSVILILGLSYYVLNEIVLPKIHKRRLGAIETLPIKNKEHENFEREGKIKKKILVIGLSAIMVLSVLGGFIIFSKYQESYKRPIIAYSSGNYCIWLQNSSERVGKNIDICIESSPVIEAVDISLAKNEYAAFQLVWRPLGAPINSLTYQISDFVHQESQINVIGNGNFSLRYEDYVLQEEFADVLIPFSTMNLDLKQNFIFWFAIRTPYNTTSGVYNGNLTFNFNSGESEVINIRLNVWNFTIPEMRHLRTSFGSFVENDDILNTYISHRINDYGVRIYQADTLTELNSEETYTCYLNETTDIWTFNWTWWDNEIEKRLNSSMNGFGLRDPLTMGRDPPVDNLTMMTRFKNWLQAVEAHLIANNWINYCYYYFIDEFNLNIPAGYTKEQYYVNLEKFLQEMKTAAPNIKVMSTGPPEADTERFNSYFDIYCPVSDMRDKERWDDLLNNGAEFWFYPCVGPYAPWPNSHLYNRLYESRVLLWQTWLYKIHGYLYWHSTAYRHGAYGMGYNSYGEGWFLYERDGAVYDSLRWENYLDGQEDYEYIWLMDAALNYLKVNPGVLLESKIRFYREELNDIIDSIVGEEWQYCDHPSTLYAGRDRIGNILNELGGIINITQIGEAPWFPP